MENEPKNENIYQLNGKVPLGTAIPIGLQHVSAMFASNLTPILIITGICGISSGSALQITILQNAMLIAGLITLIQVIGMGPIGGRLPIVMGTSSGFIGVCRGIAGSMGGGLIGYGAILGASLIGGLFEGVLGLFLKPLRKFFPPIVTGTVVLSIGLSLISIGTAFFAGGFGAKDFGSLENLALGFFVLVVIVFFRHAKSPFLRATSIIIGIIAGYIASTIMGLFLQKTMSITAADGSTVEVVKAWVLQTSKIGTAKWFAVPKIMPVKFVFSTKAIFPMIIMFLVTTVETIGDVSGITQGGLDREATDKELSGSVICDGVGSSFATLFGVLPNTSFSQNVGLVGMTHIVNRFVIAVGGIALVICGLFPKLAAVISIMPYSVLGGAAVMMFASITVSGIELITKEKLTNRNITILIVSLGLGYGLGASSAAVASLPSALQLIFSGGGIVPAAIFAIVLNIVLPKEAK